MQSQTFSTHCRRNRTAARLVFPRKSFHPGIFRAFVIVLAINGAISYFDCLFFGGCRVSSHHLLIFVKRVSPGHALQPLALPEGLPGRVERADRPKKQKDLYIMKRQLEKILSSTLSRCFESGVLSAAPIPPYVIEIPNNPAHGHFATNVAMLLASSQKRPPAQIAAGIVENLDDPDQLLEQVEVAPPGFINFTIAASRWRRLAAQIAQAGDEYGRNDSAGEKKILLEFVSANPTGPLHLGHGRGAAIGDTLARILDFCGCDVSTEFYVNDAGLQMKLLGESIYARWRQSRDPDFLPPENGYQGEYISELAGIISEETDLEALAKEEAVNQCTSRGKKLMLKQIAEDLSTFRVSFDRWYNESELFSSGLVEKTVTRARDRGQVYEDGGAVWLRTSTFGDDKNRVLIKQDGYHTYFASDIAYHLDKYARGYTSAVNIWGADHHGYVPRMKAALNACGISPEWLSVILIQLVKLWKGGQEVKMSKRAGQFVTLRELCEEVGVDAVRFVFLTKSHDSPLDFDADLVTKKDSENPVYYVQYAHARACSIFRRAAEAGIPVLHPGNAPVGKLEMEEEFALIRKMAEFPALLEEIAASFEAHRLTYYLGDLAGAFHRYFNMGNKDPDYRILTADPEVSGARLLLVQAVKTVIANGLALMGVTAPERM
jgi:arginyl-tRNA synthetase